MTSPNKHHDNRNSNFEADTLPNDPVSEPTAADLGGFVEDKIYFDISTEEQSKRYEKLFGEEDGANGAILISEMSYSQKERESASEASDLEPPFAEISFQRKHEERTIVGKFVDYKPTTVSYFVSDGNGNGLDGNGYRFEIRKLVTGPQEKTRAPGYGLPKAEDLTIPKEQEVADLAAKIRSSHLIPRFVTPETTSY